jgi:hypothetical protein
MLRGSHASQRRQTRPRKGGKQTYPLVIPRPVQPRQPPRLQLLPRHRIRPMFPQERNDSQQIIHRSIGGADGSVEGFEGEGATVEGKF